MSRVRGIVASVGTLRDVWGWIGSADIDFDDDDFSLSSGEMLQSCVETATRAREPIHQRWTRGKSTHESDGGVQKVPETEDELESETQCEKCTTNMDCPEYLSADDRSSSSYTNRGESFSGDVRLRTPPPSTLRGLDVAKSPPLPSSITWSTEASMESIEVSGGGILM